MFDVHFFQSLLGKNNLALMGERAGVRGGIRLFFHPLPFTAYRLLTFIKLLDLT
jgi:hypothetical protein